MQKARTIDEVIEQLSHIIASEVSADSTASFFPILYKKVTQRIKQGIVNQEFEDNERMEQLDVIFANRYIEAYLQWKKGNKPTQSWLHAFSEKDNSKLIIMQHLLLGINAHINLDLGIAALETVEHFENLEAFKNDFNAINNILESMVNEVQEKIGSVSPLFYLLEKVGKGKEDKIASFSINLARDGAWLFANEYALSQDRTTTIENRDTIIASLAYKLTRPKSRILRWTIRMIRFLEAKKVSDIARVLSA